MSFPIIPGIPGDKLVPPLNAPAAGTVMSGVQPGVSSEIVLAQYVVVFGSTGGVFVYSGTPAHGNPPLYWMGNVTADPYGNAVNPGIWAGQSTGAQVGIQVNAGSGEILFPFPGTFLAQARVGAKAVGSGAGVEMVSPQDASPNNDFVRIVLEDSASSGAGATWLLVYDDASGGSNTHANGSFAGMQMPVVESMSAVAPGSGTSNTNPATPEGWHGMSLANGWANDGGNVSAQYRLIPSPPNSVELIGTLLATGATSTTFFTLPSAYRPNSVQQFACGATAGIAAGKAPYVNCTTGGVLSIPLATTGAADVYPFHGTIALDA